MYLIYLIPEPLSILFPKYTPEKSINFHPQKLLKPQCLSHSLSFRKQQDDEHCYHFFNVLPDIWSKSISFFSANNSDQYMWFLPLFTQL